MGKTHTYNRNTGLLTYRRNPGCWIYQPRTDSWSRSGETSFINGTIWPHDHNDDWGLVMSTENNVEFTKDGVHFNHTSFEGKILCIGMRQISTKKITIDAYYVHRN